MVYGKYSETMQVVFPESRYPRAQARGTHDRIEINYIFDRTN